MTFSNNITVYLGSLFPAIFSSSKKEAFHLPACMFGTVRFTLFCSTYIGYVSFSPFTYSWVAIERSIVHLGESEKKFSTKQHIYYKFRSEKFHIFNFYHLFLVSPFYFLQQLRFRFQKHARDKRVKEHKLLARREIYWVSLISCFLSLGVVRFFGQFFSPSIFLFFSVFLARLKCNQIIIIYC